MGGVVSKVSGLITGVDAEKESQRAADAQLGYQQRALDYLKETDVVPRELREAALTRLGAMFGVPRMGEDGQPLGGDALASQEERIALAQQSPLYQEILGGRQAGEEALMRNAGMTGGLRSGNIQSALYDYNTRLQQKALTDAYNQQIAEENRMLQGLSGLADLPSLATGIAQQTNAMGQTMADRYIGAAEAQANQARQGFGDIAQIAGMFAGSDKRLKKNIEKIGEKNGFNWYRWTWNEKAFPLGLMGESEGVIAQEVQPILPEAVIEKDGYLHVNYNKILREVA